MGRASRAKAQARAIREDRDRPNLLRQLNEHIDFLKASSAAFDNGFEAEAKRLAVSLRVLLHDTIRSHALLDQLGIKAKLRLTETSEPITPGSLSPLGLVLLELSLAAPRGRYIAPLGRLSPPRIKSPVKFDSWWLSTVYVDADSVEWSRKQFVLTLANVEGGAHIDPNLDAAYERLVNKNGLGWTAQTISGPEPFSGSPVAASVRQIAYEVLGTLERQSDLIK